MLKLNFRDNAPSFLFTHRPYLLNYYLVPDAVFAFLIMGFKSFHYFVVLQIALVFPPMLDFHYPGFGHFIRYDFALKFSHRSIRQ